MVRSIYLNNVLGDFSMNLQEMAETHLGNVQREIAALKEQQKRIEQDIKTLTEYLERGVAVLESERSKNVNP